MNGTRTATAFAPAGIGNVAVGFDLLGHPITGMGDEVTVTLADEPGIHIDRIEGVCTDLPTDPAANTATAGLLRLTEYLEPGTGLRVSIRKGIPTASGLAGSAASAVAAVLAADQVLGNPLTPRQRYACALAGESVASDSTQADNVAACLNGGLTLVDTVGQGVRSIPVPEDIRCVVVHPDFALETRAGRKVLEDPYPLETCTRQQACLATFLVGCFTGDVDLIGAALRDVLVEPRRAPLVPGFHAVQAAAMAEGALGCSLSGSGPAVFAWCRAQTAESCGRAMEHAFSGAGFPCSLLISPVNAPGARLTG